MELRPRADAGDADRARAAARGCSGCKRLAQFLGLLGESLLHGLHLRFGVVEYEEGRVFTDEARLPGRGWDIAICWSRPARG